MNMETGKVENLDEEDMLTSPEHQATNDLVVKKLNADESFRILQDMLEQCINEVYRRKLS
ncbi:MAG: hypothetical protein ABGY95_07565 [Rubritalea sp.]|uniref:hypothetical protein n=1 Tax=Rubritalea sp. TaxID=2109375 RepID=UPI003242ED94